MKLLLFFVLLLAVVSAKAQVLTFTGTKCGVYNNRKYLMHSIPNYYSKIIITKDTITFEDSTRHRKYEVLSISSQSKWGQVVYSFFCNQKVIVLLDIKKKYVTIQKPDTIRIYSGTSPILTKFTRNK